MIPIWVMGGASEFFERTLFTETYEIREILLEVFIIIFIFTSTHKVAVEKLIKQAEKSPFAALNEMIELFSFSANYSLASKNVHDLINRYDLHFDVVINEEFFHDSFSMFGHRFNAPVVTICKQNIQTLNFGCSIKVLILQVDMEILISSIAKWDNLRHGVTFHIW